MMSRMETLRALLEQEPVNSRIRFMLSMEYLAAGSWSEAVAELKELIRREPAYVAAYMQAGRASEQLGDADGARALYRQGIEAARRAGDAHTRSELEAALEILGA